jgi:hypothetical protein
MTTAGGGLRFPSFNFHVFRLYLSAADTTDWQISNDDWQDFSA